MHTFFLSDGSSMLETHEALAIILHSVKPLGTEQVELTKAYGRTLAADIVAHASLPPFDNSSMDGFAVMAADIERAAPSAPVLLKIVGEASAGKVFKGRLRTGEAVRIMTGAMIPAGADSVVPIEVADVRDDQSVAFVAPTALGANIRRAGEDIAKNSTVLRRGHLLTPARIGVLAALGITRVRVVHQPLVKILTTGDELVPYDVRPKAGQIRNSSSHVLIGYVERAGAVARFLGIVGDEGKRLRRAIRSGLDADVLLITGGISMGKYDLVKETLAALGVRIRFWRVNIKPGKPLLFGTFGSTLVFGLPGNPVSTSVTFIQFVKPALASMLGRIPDAPTYLSAILDEPVAKRDGKRHFMRGIATMHNGALHVRPQRAQSSGMVSSLAHANCLIIVPEDVEMLETGSNVMVQFIDS